MVSNQSGDDQGRLLAFTLLTVTSLAVVWAFLPELRAGPNQYSDTSFHLAIIQQMRDAAQAGGSVFDFIFDGSPFSHPLVRAYQSLPHLTMYLVYRALWEVVSLPTIVAFFTLVLAALLPWSFYLMTRMLGYPPLQGAIAGLLAVLISEVGGYGMGMQNYSWGTHGIISQLWALVFVAPAIGYAINFLRTGSHLSTALLLVFLGCGSHLLSVHLIGFSIVTAAVVLLLAKATLAIVMKRLVLFVIGCGSVISYQLVTLIPDTGIIHQSVLEPKEKFTSHGLKWTYAHLLDGTLFDNGRTAVISFMVFLGAVLLLLDSWRATQRDRRLYAAVLLACFGIWLSLLAGYEVWGWLFGSLPGLSSMHMHRFIVGVHIFGVCIAARGCAEVFRQIPSRAVALLLILVVLFPAFAERAEAFSLRHSWISNIRYAEDEERELNDVIALLKAAPRGWVYSGMARDWAKDLRVANATPMYHRLMIAGLPAYGMLFHPFGLAGDVMFEFDPLKLDRYDLFNVRYVIAPSDWSAPQFLTLRRTYTRFSLYEYAAASPIALARLEFEGWGTKEEAARFMTRWISLGMAARGQYGEIVKRPSGARQGVVFRAQTPLLLNGGSIPPAGIITDSKWYQERVEATISLDEQGLVVFKVGYHPRWELSVNGERVPTIRVSPGFIGAQISKGEHRLVLSYRAWQPRAALFFLCLLLPFISLAASKRGDGRSL